MTLEALLAKRFVLPSVPRVVALLLSELDQPEPDLRRVNQLVSTDPALTVRLLQWANSDFFRLSGRVNSVPEALAILGLGQVRALGAEAATSASLRAVPGIALLPFCAYSLDVAKLARSLAGVVRQNQQAAFTCGLIHAVGELALHLAMPDAALAMDREVAPLELRRARLQRRQWGFCYAQVGAGLARQWQLPQPIVDALEHQYAPFDNEVFEPLAGVVHLATWRARARAAALPEKALVDSFPGPVGEVLGLDVDMVLQQDPIDWSARGAARRRA
ncbi:MAG: HDOD domain-containing protein [Betaproteobacteria bacterium]|jgi:HD-like signal output (HDOD) protein